LMHSVVIPAERVKRESRDPSTTVSERRTDKEGRDPIKLGLVSSLNRPGGNLTGVTTLASLVVAKQFEVLHETVPKATVIGCLVNPSNPNAESDTREAREATQTLGVELHIENATAEDQIEAAFAALVRLRAGAVVVVSDALFNSRPNQIVA